MMSDEVAISVRDVTKKYRLFTSPTDRFKEALHPLRKRYHHEFWALKGINFDIRRGQVVGLVGRNGVGKSTLLQIIAGILQPTSGTVTVNGLTSALLELGAGFNHEFTGRDNVILNGAIVGRSRTEMLRRLPDIEAFAAIGEFFDQPVKTYSSGMFARLAFAAAVNLDPDVFIIDEILAVGDIRFQNKCYSKLEDLQSRKKTIIIVSHDPEAIIRHCHRAILIENGHLDCDGPPREVVSRYFELIFSRAGNFQLSKKKESSTQNENRESHVTSEVEAFLTSATGLDRCAQHTTYNREEYRFGEGGMQIVDYMIVVGDSINPTEVESGATIDLYVKAFAKEAVRSPSVGISVKTVDGITLYGVNTEMQGVNLPSLQAGQTVVVLFSIVLGTAAGDTFFDLGCGDWSTRLQRALDHRHGVIHLKVTTGNQFNGLANLRCITELKALLPESENGTQQQRQM